MSNPGDNRRDPARLSSADALLSIGDVAARSGKRPSTIRYYEEIGLLPAPARIAGKRAYDASVVRTLAVIETGQRAGLTLDEIGTLLSASPSDATAIDALREVAERKLPVITALIQRSELVRDWLECAARCECPTLDDCPLFDESSLPPQDVGRRRAVGPDR